MEHRVHDALVEGIVVADDDLMERYLEGETPSAKELEATLARGVAEASVFPVVCGSAARNIAIDRLAELICEIGPSPLERRPVEVRAGDGTIAVAPDPTGQPLARVFKTIADPYVGKISLIHVLSGTLRPDATLVNSRTHAEERLHALQLLRGKEASPITEAQAGDIIAVPKLADARTGDTLAPKSSPVVIEARPAPTPLLSMAVRPRAKGDEDKLMTALHRMQEEDVALAVRRDDETHQTVLSGMGDTHLQIVCEKLHRKFGVEVEVSPVKVPYRETISKTAEAEGKYKKQTGGHGQFGVADLRIEPLERGEGFQFVDAIVGGAIPRQFIPAVEKGIAEAMSTGGVHGFPVVDVRVTCYDGKYHSVDSSEMSFKMAGALGFREAMQAAGPVLLEPISRLEVTVPASAQGDVLGDLNSRRGRVLGTEAAEHGEQVVIALVPTSEIMRYATDLRSRHRRPGTLSRPARPVRGRAPADGRARREGGPRRRLRLPPHTGSVAQAAATCRVAGEVEPLEADPVPGEQEQLGGTPPQVGRGRAASAPDMELALADLDGPGGIAVGTGEAERAAERRRRLLGDVCAQMDHQALVNAVHGQLPLAPASGRRRSARRRSGGPPSRAPSASPPTRCRDPRPPSSSTASGGRPARSRRGATSRSSRATRSVPLRSVCPRRQARAGLPAQPPEPAPARTGRPFRRA